LLASRSQTLRTLNQISWETVEFMTRMLHAADRFGEETSEGLFACFGGVVGVILGYALSLEEPAASFALTGPLGGALGIMAGIFFRRGPGRFWLEWKVQNRQIEDQAKARQAELLLEQLRSLPTDAPYGVREEIWTAYRNILRELAQASSRRLGPAE
jgi:hypothetical protein